MTNMTQVFENICIDYTNINDHVLKNIFHSPGW